MVLNVMCYFFETRGILNASTVTTGGCLY